MKLHCMPGLHCILVVINLEIVAGSTAEYSVATPLYWPSCRTFYVSISLEEERICIFNFGE